MRFIIFSLLFWVPLLESAHTPIPMQFSIHESKVVSTIPKKDRDFAFIVPGDFSTYIYNDEQSYYQDYQRSLYAVTRVKGGWDCMRHYEILANGCIPYFVDIDACPEQDMIFFPKGLVKEAMNLPGVSYLRIDHELFDRTRYDAILKQLLDYTRKHLTTRAMAQYLLNTIGYKGTGKVLMLSGSTYPDYARCLTLTGLRDVLGDRFIDFPKIEHLYKNYIGNIRSLYGKGMSYTQVLDDTSIDRKDILFRIFTKEFDVIIYGSVHRGLPFYDVVSKIYTEDQIVYICGEDNHPCEYLTAAKKWFFLREFDNDATRYSFSWFMPNKS